MVKKKLSLVCNGTIHKSESSNVSVYKKAHESNRIEWNRIAHAEVLACLAQTSLAPP